MDEYVSFVETHVNDISEKSGKRCYVNRDGGYTTFYCEGTKLFSKRGWYDMHRYLNDYFNDVVDAVKKSVSTPRKKDPIASAKISIDVPVVSCGGCGHQYLYYVVLDGETVLNQVQSEYCPDCGTKRSWD